MIFINMKNHFTSGLEKYRHKHYYILAVPLALTVSMFWSDNIALTSISLINIDTPRDIDGFNVFECTKVILLSIVLCQPH